MNFHRIGWLILIVANADLTELETTNGISNFVQGWRPEPDAHHVGHDHDESATDPGFRRKSNLMKIVHLAKMPVNRRQDKIVNTQKNIDKKVEWEIFFTPIFKKYCLINQNKKNWAHNFLGVLPFSPNKSTTAYLNIIFK